MRFINFIFFAFFLLNSCNKDRGSISNLFPPYKLIVTFSERIKSKTELVLRSYGVNHNPPEGYQLKNGLADFTAGYVLFKTQTDTISTDSARTLIVSLTESLLQEINSNLTVRNDLSTYPWTSDLLYVSIHFEDENHIDLGTGVCAVYFANGKIHYDRYEIYEYTGRHPAIGKHFTIHEETYAEALDIVKREGTLVYF